MQIDTHERGTGGTPKRGRQVVNAQKGTPAMDRLPVAMLAGLVPAAPAMVTSAYGEKEFVDGRSQWPSWRNELAERLVLPQNPK